MTTFTIELTFTVATAASDDEFEEHTDAVYEHLLGLDGISDANMAVAVAERHVSFMLDATADDAPRALSVAYGAVRTAIHAENGATPGWEEALMRGRMNVAPADTSEPAFA